MCVRVFLVAAPRVGNAFPCREGGPEVPITGDFSPAGTDFFVLCSSSLGVTVGDIAVFLKNQLVAPAWWLGALCATAVAARV